MEVTIQELLGPLNSVEQKQAPSKLYYAGDVSLLRDASCVSIVGSRKASEEGKKRASYLTKEFVRKSIVVLSGLAEGIDTIAHLTAIKEGGRTVAVLGSPLDKFYPEENMDLQKLIMSDHLAISQFPFGTTIKPQNFPIRNRTMALLSNATVIVEAKDGSGSLHQGWEALRLGRPLFIMESMTKNTSLSWTKDMIHYGAQILTKENIDLLFELIPQGGVSNVAEFSI